MLIGNSVPEYIFIRLNIFILRSIAPTSIAFTIVTIASLTVPTIDLERMPLAFEIYFLLEAAFFLVVYLPLKAWLQYAASHPEPLDKAKRQTLFRRMVDTVPNGDRYLSGWFLGVHAKDIHRESVKEFLAWSMLNEHLDQVDEAQMNELNRYVDNLEEKLGQKLRSTGAKRRSLRTTFDHVPMQHHPLLWYLIVCMVDFITHFRLALSSFHFYRASLTSTLATFPPRPLALLGRRAENVRLSYWYREHTSKTKLPLVFIQGIGIGLYPYVDFIPQMAAQDYDKEDNGSIGMIVIEILPISSRICRPALTTEEMTVEIGHILNAHGWKDFVLTGHSYGTAIASTILQHPKMSRRVKAAVLMDPICFLLHLPDVAYNFTRRPPRRANERMLDYFSSKDMLVSHTLARRFFWTDYILWKDDIANDIPLMITLSAKDLIVPTKEVWTYLTGCPLNTSASTRDAHLGGAMEWKDGNREVIWFKDFDHAGLFNSKGARRGVASKIKRLCSVGVSHDPSTS